MQNTAIKITDINEYVTVMEQADIESYKKSIGDVYLEVGGEYDVYVFIDKDGDIKITNDSYGLNVLSHRDFIREFKKDKNGMYDNPKDLIPEYSINMDDIQEKIDWRRDWIVVEEGKDKGLMISRVKTHYHIDERSLKRKQWIIHMFGKQWVNMNTFIPAYFYALELIGVNEVFIKTSYKEFK